MYGKKGDNATDPVMPHPSGKQSTSCGEKFKSKSTSSFEHSLLLT
jgi:hypothetical protein